MTEGWAQVDFSLRGDTSIIERTKYDLYYIENWSLLFDPKDHRADLRGTRQRDRERVLGRATDGGRAGRGGDGRTQNGYMCTHSGYEAARRAPGRGAVWVLIPIRSEDRMRRADMPVPMTDDTGFQSPSGPKTGCDTSLARGSAAGTSFQSPSGPKTGCHVWPRIPTVTAICFNPRLVRRPDATSPRANDS